LIMRIWRRFGLNDALNTTIRGEKDEN